MKIRLLAVAAVCTWLACGPLPGVVEPVLKASDDLDLWFDIVLAGGEPVSRAPFAPIPGTDTMIYIGGRGQVCRTNASGVPSDPFHPFGASFRGPLSFAVGSFTDFQFVDTIFATTAEPSTHPLRVFTPGPPPSLLGETAFPAIGSSGIRIAIADVDADRTPETIIGTGPGVPAMVSVIPVQASANVITFQPFDASFVGGVFVAGGDINGDGHAEVLVAQGGGGEMKVYEVRGGEAHERGRMRPQGHGYNGGFRIAAGDFNGDGKAEIITGAMTGPARVQVIDVAVPQGRKLVDTVVSSRPADPLLGGTPVAFGRLNDNPLAYAIHFNSVYMIDEPGAPQPRIFSENPFAVIGALFMDLSTYTPPSPGQ